MHTSYTWFAEPLIVGALALAWGCGGSHKPSPEPVSPPAVAAPVPAKKPPKKVARAEPEADETALLDELMDEDEYVLSGPVGVVGGVPGGVVGGVIGGYVGGDLEELMEAPPPPPPPKPSSVAAATLLEYRVAAGPLVTPSASERRKITRSKAGHASVTIELCLSAKAEVTRTAVVGPSAYASWENALMEAMWEWRFRPYDASGTATAICSQLVFAYPEPASAQP